MRTHGKEVIINNAFFAKKDEMCSFLEINALREFCNILYDKITGENESGISYKYVCFQADEADVEEFCDIDGRFIRGIDKVYCTRAVEEETVRRINSIYAPEIQIMLKNAREAFAGE